MLNFEVSMHLQNDRGDRVAYIQRTVGFGDVIMAEMPSRGAIRALTDTGVVLVLSNDKKRLLTAFIATLSQAIDIYSVNYDTARLPKYFHKIITRNQRFCENQPR